MKIAVATVTGHPENPRVWSGTPRYFVEALRRTHDNVSLIGPVAPNALRLAGRTSSALGRAFKRKLHWEVEPRVLRQLTRVVEARALRDGADVVIAMGWYPLETSGRLQFVSWTDATLAQRLDIAPHWSNISQRTRASALAVESAVMAESRVVVASKWAAESVRQTYGVTSPVVPFGANIDDPGPIRRGVPSDSPRILAVGVEWRRKGMDVAVHAVGELRRRGVPASLDIVGVDAPDWAQGSECVFAHGRVDKQTLAQFYSRADVFLLPTRDEPFGIVFGEAAAFGLPVVASNIGNVPERVEHGRVGLLVSGDAPPSDWADAIERVLGDGYSLMTRNARLAYERDWSWDVAARRMVDISRGA